MADIDEPIQAIKDEKIVENPPNSPGKEGKYSFKCLLDTIFFTVRREDVTDVQAASVQAFGLLVILVGYIQQLGLLILDELDFGLWGNVFGNVNIISLNINVEFGELQGDIGYLLAVFLLPVAIMLWYVKVDTDDAGHDTKFPKVWIAGWVLDGAFLLTFVIVSILVNFETGSIFVIPVGYIVTLQVCYKLRDRYIKSSFKPGSEEDDDKKVKFFENELKYNDLAITFSLPLVASTWVSVGILNENKTLSVVAGIIGGVLVFWLVLRFYLRIAGAYYRDDGRIHDFLKWALLGLFLQKNIYNGGGSQDFKEALFFFPVIIYLEKIFLAAIPTLAISDLFDPDNKERAAEVGEYIVLGIIFTNFAIFSIFWPLDSKMSLRAEIFSRLSNLLIFSFALINTRFRRNQLEELEDGEDAEEELYVSIFMILISTYMLIFWLRLLDVKEFIKFVYKTNTEFIFGLWAQYRWRKVTNEKDAAKIILKRKKQQVTEAELNVLSFYKKFCSFCVPRTRQLTEAEQELVQVENAGKFELTYNSAKGVSLDVLRRFGFNSLQGMNYFVLSDYENSLADFEILASSGTLETLFKKGLKGFELDYRAITADEVQFFFDTISQFPLESLGFSNCTDKDSHDIVAFTTMLGKSVTKCEQLRTFKSEYNSFTEGTALILIENLFKLPDLTILHLSDAGLKSAEYKQIANLLVETDHKIEELLLMDNKPETVECLDEIVEAAMQTKTVRTLDVSAYGIYSNKAFRLQEDYPEMRLVVDSTGYLDFKSDREEGCNVVVIDYSEKTIEYLTRDGFTDEFIDEVEGDLCCLLSSFLYYLNDEWKEIAREHINDTFNKEGYEEEEDVDDDADTVLLPVTLTEIVLKYGIGQYLTVHALKRLKEFGADFDKTCSDGKTTLLQLAAKHKYKSVQKWAERVKNEVDLDDLDLGLDNLDLGLDDLDLGLDDIDLDLDLDLDN